jgi:Iap family predicted aminopeptidase
MFRRVLLTCFWIALAVLAIASIFWISAIRMPGKNTSTAAELSPAEIILRDELRADVRKLAGEIGERNVDHYPQLMAAADFIQNSFSTAGLQPRRDTYQLRNLPCHNIEAEIHGTSPEIVVVGAHYDSVFGSPGANDNGSGVAALLALARRFANKQPTRSLRFVAFVNEEPPYFQTLQMGSLVYAGRCKAGGDRVSAMISLETIGYFSDKPGSQTYPSPVLGAFYPKVGNFISFVGDLRSRRLVRLALSTFRQAARLSSEGAAVPAFIPGVAWSDHWSFWQQGYPAIMITDTAPFRYPHYHAPTDTPDKLNYERFALVVSGLQNVVENLISASR